MEHAADLATGGVAGVQHATNRVRRLAPEGGTSVGVAIEPRAPFEQLADVGDALLDQDADGGFIAESVAGADRVGRMEGRTVVVADRGRDASLRVTGVALAGLGLGQDEARPAPASPMAARRPAIPLPMMRKSVRSVAKALECYPTIRT